MRTKEILIVLHTLFLQHVLLSKVNAPHQSICIMSWFCLSCLILMKNFHYLPSHFHSVPLVVFSCLPLIHCALCCFCRYRKVVSNVCEGGVDLQKNLAQHMCPLIAPKGLQISIREESLAVKPGEDITFIVRQEQVVINIAFMKVSLLFLGLISLLPTLLLNED